MNRIYKVIWSKAKNCYVVASELAKNHTKGSRSRSVRVTAAQTLTAFLISAYLVGGYGVPAAMADNAGVTGANVTRSGTNASAWGNSAKAEGINTTAWGSATLAKALNSTAWGFYTKAEGQGATAWGVGYEGSTIAQEDPEYVIAKGWGSTAWGYVTQALGDYSTAFGKQSIANAANSLAALGGITAAGADGSAAIGVGAKANLANTVALGGGSVANRAAGVAGYRPDGGTVSGQAWVSTANAIAVGASSNNSDAATETRQITGVAAGTFDTDAVNVAQLKSAMQNGGKTYSAGNGINIDAATNKISVKTGDGLVFASGALKVKSGDIEDGSDAFVKAAALYTEMRPANGTYVNKTKTTAENLTALDTQVTANKNAIAQKANKATTLAGYGISDAFTRAETTNAISSAVNGKADKATTLQGYGITDAYTKTQVDTAVKAKADKATTLQGYGITDAYTKAQVDTAVKAKADKATTLAGYGITDAYTKAQVDTAVKAKADKATTLAGYGITDAYTKAQVDKADTALSNRIGTLKKDGNIIKSYNNVSENLTVLDTTLSDVKTTAEQTKADLQLIAAVSDISLDAINNIADEVVERTKEIDGIYSMDGQVVPEGDSGADEFVRGDTVYEEVRPTDGVYVQEDNTTADNLTALDTNLKETADALKTEVADRKDALNSEANARISADTALSNRIGTLNADGNVIKKDKNVSENLVLLDQVIQTQSGTTKEQLDKKANADASNVGKNATAADGSAADNSAAWGNALGTGAVESGDGKLVTGGTVYSEVRPQTDGNYVKKSSTTSANLTALDKQVKTNTDSIAENSDKITANAQGIAKNAQNIETNTKNIAANAQNIAANSQMIKTNAKNIETNTKDIAANAQNIAANSQMIKTNAQNIETNAQGIAKNVQNIETNAKGIATNAQNIATNSQKIKTNTENINVARMIADDAMHGVSVLLIGTGLNVEDIIATDAKVDALAKQNGQVEPSSNDFIKGKTVYEYLNDGKNETLTLGKNTTKIAIGKGSEATGERSVSIGTVDKDGNGNVVKGNQSIAIGSGLKVYGSNAGAIGDPMVVAADESYVVGNNNHIGNANYKDGDKITENNIFVVGNDNTISGSNTFVLGSKVNTDAKNAVVLGDGSVGVDNAVSVGAPKNERQIKHVAPGVDATDAATVGQMDTLAQTTAGSISRLDNKVNKVGAGAAALAALHPIDTDDKFSMGLGYGNYRDAHAAAIGMFYRPTDKIMISMGGTMGSGENLLNAGISFALDKGKGFGTSKAMMARQLKTQGEALEEQRKATAEQEAKIRTLQEENAAIKEQNAKLAARLAAIEAKLGK